MIHLEVLKENKNKNMSTNNVDEPKLSFKNKGIKADLTRHKAGD